MSSFAELHRVLAEEIDAVGVSNKAFSRRLLQTLLSDNASVKNEYLTRRFIRL